MQLFVNTRDVDERTDELADSGAASAWLGAHGLAGAGERPLRRPDVERLLEVREALRELLLANNGEPATLERVRRVVNRAAAAKYHLHVGQSLTLVSSTDPGAFYGQSPVTGGLKRALTLSAKLSPCSSGTSNFDKAKSRSGGILSCVPASTSARTAPYHNCSFAPGTVTN